MSSILDALGYAGDLFNKPGRAVRGLLAGKTDEAAAALPFSDTLGLTDQANQTSGRDLLAHFGVDPGEGTIGDLAGFGTELATDPLSFLGAGVGAGLGRKAGQAAMARGPRFATTLDDAERIAAEAGQVGVEHLERMKYLPGGERALGELPPGSSYLGHGSEGMAFKTPENDVLRMGLVDAGEKGRPVASGMLGTTRAIDYPGLPGQAWRVERTPLADTADPLLQYSDQLLKSELGGQGIKFMDRHAGNMGMVGGRPVVIDPGAVDVSHAFTGGREAVTQAAEPGMLMRALIGLGGGDDAVRAAIAAGHRSPGWTLPGAAYGGSAGLLSGAFGRSLGG